MGRIGLDGSGWRCLAAERHGTQGQERRGRPSKTRPRLGWERQDRNRRTVMKQYAWRSGFPIPPIAADVFGQIKERIEAENGVVRPADIVAEAGRPGSPLRPALEWDDAKAADAHRIDQARRLLGALQVVRVQIEHSPAVSSKAMFRVRPDHGPAGYVSQDKIIGDRELRKQVIGSARKELESFVGKYAGVLAMGTFIPRLQDVINEMLDEIERLEVDASRRQTKARSSEEPLAYREAAQ